jgi:hypothetical protein
LPLRNCRNGKPAVAEICHYVSHDFAQPRGANPARFRDHLGVICGAHRQRDEVLEVRRDKSLEFRRLRRLLVREIASVPAGTILTMPSSMLPTSGTMASRGTRNPMKLTGAG